MIHRFALLGLHVATGCSEEREITSNIDIIIGIAIDGQILNIIPF